MAGPPNRRVKVFIGSEAWPLTPENRPPGIPEDHTTGWKVYVRNLEGGPNINVWLKKVQFKLFHTYTPALRTAEQEPFEVTETGWGGFQVDIRLHFQPVTSEKAQWRFHYLQLEPYGSDADKAQQKARGRVVSESVEILEFNEPSEPLWEALTSDSQWDYLNPAKGGGKGKAKGRGQMSVANMPVIGLGTSELADKSTPSNPYSKEMEDKYIRSFETAGAEVERLLQEENERLKKNEERIQELTESGDFVPSKKK
ncbi:yeats-domain-containing protein [Eremomyces bilateralis CBS 781.70]|uniref:Protein AF-9 homolog n=1 Tax=Eremomyces bilateralis CBS 781.70 TaxID=1392243 RepID=A0A6G1GFF9_9PEZI|nr:yeats-domain-containing protein [Eremomyces bilateralis CBS 781.70]KAF1816651.1 yeats-domain-containing protein [Eremomyces bilateralis CBS 781.70]